MMKENFRLMELKINHFCSTNKKPIDKQFIRSPPHYSEDEENFHQNQQQNHNNEMKKLLD